MQSDQAFALGYVGRWQTDLHNFFHAQLLLHISCDFDQAFIETLSLCALVCIFSDLRFLHISRNYCPLLRQLNGWFCRIAAFLF